MLGDLLDHVVGAVVWMVMRDSGVFGRRHGERLDVVATGENKPTNAGQGARFVFKQNGNDVF